MSDYICDFNSAVCDAIMREETSSYENMKKMTPYHMNKNEALLYIVSCIENGLPARITFYNEKDTRKTQSRKASDSKYTDGCVYAPVVYKNLYEVIVWEGKIYKNDEEVFISSRDNYQKMGWEVEKASFIHHETDMVKLIEKAKKASHYAVMHNL